MASLTDADRARYLLAWIPPTHHDALGLPLRLSSLLTGENLVDRQLWRSRGSCFADCLELAFTMTGMFEGDTVPRPILRCWGWMEA